MGRNVVEHVDIAINLHFFITRMEKSHLVDIIRLKKNEKLIIIDGDIKY